MPNPTTRRTNRKADAPAVGHGVPTASNEPHDASAVETEVDDSKPLGRFAQLARDAVADYVPKKPYVLDELEPPIVITEPVETERIIAFAMLMDPSIEISPAKFQPLLQAVCGDVYPRVWTDLLRGKHFKVTSAFMRDVVTHFYPEGR